MTREDKKEVAGIGLFIGLLLFLSTLINLLIEQDMLHLQLIGKFIIPIVAFYCILGIFIRWMVYRSTLRREGFHMFSGMAIVYWIEIFSIIFIAAAYFIPQVIRYTVLANIIVLLLFWFIDHIYLKNIAKELNSGLEYYGKSLVEDLPGKPQSEDIFMEQIIDYCNKNNLSLEIIEYGIPAKIKMNNVKYMVRLGQYCTMIGSIVYTMEFQNIVSKINNSMD